MQPITDPTLVIIAIFAMGYLTGSILRVFLAGVMRSYGGR